MMSLPYGSQLTIAGGGSMNSTQTELLMAHYTSGMQLHGRMSAIRRFFCLFVTFDFLFTSLFWIICILITGQDILQELSLQILQYTFSTSIFDIVATSAARFLLLIFFYAILHINHWWLVAITTSCSCAFIVVKTLFYKWIGESHSVPFEVMLFLISFLIVWSEAWFIDFRVLPQEARARSILEVACGGFAEERVDDRSRDLSRLQNVRDYLSHRSESIVNFYSPFESPTGSDDEESLLPRAPKKLSSRDAEFVYCGEEAIRLSWEVLNSSGWKLEKTISHTDVILTKIGPSGYKIYKLMATIEVNPESIFNECLHSFESIPAWNRAITKCSLIQMINSTTDITYQVAAEGPGGVVTSRDFVSVRSWSKMEDSWVFGGRSVEHRNAPVSKQYVRGENGPTCFVFSPIEDYPNRCSFQWLLDIDLKGWIPKYVKEQALLYAISDFLSCLRTYSHILAAKNKEL